MTETNSKRPNRGGQLLSRVDDSIRDVAAHIGVSPTTAGYWRTGERKPNPADRERLQERYGIPVESWEEPPVAIGRPKSPPAADRPCTAALPTTAATRAPDPGDENLDASLQINAARLNRMILADIARLEGANGADLELGKRAEILKKLSDAQVSLAKATGETTLTMQRIVAHPEFQRVVRLIVEAIAPFPEALRAATAALELARE